MINTITLNPAIDSLLFIDSFRKNVTARIRERAEALGGKGAHISVNLALMGEPNQAFGMLFGETGKKIESMVSRTGAVSKFIYGEGGEGRESRTNFVVIEDSGDSTIIAEQGVLLSEPEIRSVIKSLLDGSEEGDSFVFSGDASNVSDPYIYNRFIEEVRGKAGKIFVDASGLALRKAIEASPFLIKPNRDELEDATGVVIKNDEDAVRAIRSLDRYEIKNIALTLGGEGAMVRFEDGSILRADAPEVTVRNTTGCGDAFLSGLILGFSRGLGHETMLRLAAAMSAATAASPLSVGFDKNYAESLIEKVEVKTISRCPS